MSEQTRGECLQCERFEREVDRLNQENDRLKQQVETLTAALEEARRAGKRQAAPFRKKPAKRNPKKPGRKPGPDYGQHRRREIPEAIDETYDVPLPDACPKCGGTHLTETAVHTQYQVEIPRQPISRQFDVHCGRCDDCGGAV